MTTRCNSIIRAAFLILALALWSIPSGTHAQPAPCACNYYTFSVDSTVNCSVTICWAVSQIGSIECRTIPPGGSLRIPCPLYEAYIRLCNGSFFTIIGTNPGGVSRCTEGIVVGTFCCVRACRTTDAQGCTEIRISPWSCAGADC